MIAKCIKAPKASRGFQGLGAYVLNVKAKDKRADPASWQRLNAYILDDEHGGEKVAWARVSNCVSTDPGWAVKEVTATQARNTRSKKGKDYHLVVSFPEGERPTREQMEDIEDRLCEAIGLGDHQRISAVHQNTDNWHLHVAISTVHPVTFRNVAPFRDHFRLQEACAELEAKHGLTIDNHTTQQDATKGRRNGRADDAAVREGGIASFLTWVREEAAPALLAARETGHGWQEVHRAAAAHGLTLKLRGAGLLVGHARDGRLHVKASDVDRGLSLKALTDKLGQFEPAGQVAAAQQAAKSYSRGSLYEAFKQERDAAALARATAMTALRERHAAFSAELKAFYAARLKAEKAAGLRGHLRRDSYQHIIDQRQRQHDLRVKREAKERAQVREAYRAPKWQGWLEAQAARGNVEAVRVMQARQLQMPQSVPQQPPKVERGRGADMER